MIAQRLWNPFLLLVNNKFPTFGSHTLEQVCGSMVDLGVLDKCVSGIPSLFLPIEGGDVAEGATSQILELQAINPVESRSWFLENEVIAGVYPKKMLVFYVLIL